MYINLRNLSEEFEQSVEEVKEHFQINTNSKAVEICTVNYLKKLKEIENLKQRLNDANNKISRYERNLDQLKSLFSWINE